MTLEYIFWIAVQGLDLLLLSILILAAGTSISAWLLGDYYDQWDRWDD